MAAYSVSIMGTEIPDNRRMIVELAVNGMISIISMWVGARLQKHKDEQ